MEGRVSLGTILPEGKSSWCHNSGKAKLQKELRTHVLRSKMDQELGGGPGNAVSFVLSKIASSDIPPKSIHPVSLPKQCHQQWSKHSITQGFMVVPSLKPPQWLLVKFNLHQSCDSESLQLHHCIQILKTLDQKNVYARIFYRYDIHNSYRLEITR